MMLTAVSQTLWMAFTMGWEILWPLILGFALSAAVQAVVSHREMSRLFPDDRPRPIAIALVAGMFPETAKPLHAETKNGMINS
jgi:uncharacterized protein